MAALALSTEKVLTPSDARVAPIRFAKREYCGTPRVVIRQAASWVTVPADDLDAFIHGLRTALAFTGEHIESIR